jgi:RecA/RadA recombinase
VGAIDDKDLCLVKRKSQEEKTRIEEVEIVSVRSVRALLPTSVLRGEKSRSGDGARLALTME